LSIGVNEIIWIFIRP